MIALDPDSEFAGVVDRLHHETERLLSTFAAIGILPTCKMNLQTLYEPCASCHN